MAGRLAGSEPTGRKYNAKEVFADPKVAELAEAARDGEVERVNELVAQGAKPNAKGKEGFTPLMYAMSGKSVNGFKRLLELGGDPNLQTERGESVMSFAAHRQESECLKLALKHGGNPNLRSRPAAKSNFDSTPPFIVVVFDPTPIFDAVGSRNVENARILIKAGADINARTANGDVSLDGQTPLHEAALLGSFDVMYVLLEAGADFRVKDKLGFPLSFYILGYRGGPNSEVARSREKCMEFMRKHGVDFDEERVKNAEIQRRVLAETARHDKEQIEKRKLDHSPIPGRHDY
jgi:ankyrin repeat protein